MVLRMRKRNTIATSMVVVVGVLLGATGCSPYQPPSARVRGEMGSVGLRVLRSQPEQKVTGHHTVSKAPGTVAGAAGGAVFGVATAVHCGPLALLIWPAFAATGAAVGGAHAAVTLPTAREVDEVDAFVRQSFARAALDDELGRGIASALPRHRERPVFLLDGAEDRRARTVAEVRLVEVGFTSRQSDRSPPLTLWMTAEVILRRASDGVEIYRGRVIKRGPTHSLLRWGDPRQRILERDLAKTARWLGERVVVHLFEATRPMDG